jgi:hypothetical protein
MNACGLEVFQQPPMIEVKSPLFVFVENGIGQPPIRARFIFGTLCRRKGERPNLLAGLMTQGCYGLVPTVDSFFYFLSRPPMGRRDSALLFLRHKPEAWSDHIESHREADKSKWSPSAGPGPRSSFCSPAWPSNRKTSAEAGGHMASAYSAPIRPPIPLEGGHPIRSNPASHSGAFRPPVPEQSGHIVIHL